MSERGTAGVSTRRPSAQPARSTRPPPGPTFGRPEDRLRVGRSRRADDRGPPKQGFTLIELLVALAVFSLAAMALLNLSGENTRSAARVETRTLGGVVAENLAVEAMIAPSVTEGVTTGEAPLAGRPWRWTRTVSATDDPDLIRIDIRVRDGEAQAAGRTIFRSRVRP